MHTAVMYGEDDYSLGMEVGFPAQHTVGMDGKFIQGTHNDIDGKYVKDCDDIIIDLLEKEGLLYREHSYTHDYPHFGGLIIHCCTMQWTAGSLG